MSNYKHITRDRDRARNGSLLYTFHDEGKRYYKTISVSQPIHKRMDEYFNGDDYEEGGFITTSWELSMQRITQEEYEQGSEEDKLQ